MAWYCPRLPDSLTIEVAALWGADEARRTWMLSRVMTVWRADPDAAARAIDSLSGQHRARVLNPRTETELVDDLVQLACAGEELRHRMFAINVLRNTVQDDGMACLSVKDRARLSAVAIETFDHCGADDAFVCATMVAYVGSVETALWCARHVGDGRATVNVRGEPTVGRSATSALAFVLYYCPAAGEHEDVQKAVRAAVARDHTSVIGVLAAGLLPAAALDATEISSDHMTNFAATTWTKPGVINARSVAGLAGSRHREVLLRKAPGLAAVIAGWLVSADVHLKAEAEAAFAAMLGVVPATTA